MRDYKAFFTQYWEYLAIKTAAKEGIFDLIEDGVNTLDAIIELKGYNRKVLNDLLIAMENSGLLSISDGKIYLTEDGKLFTEHHPDSLKYACIHWAEEHMIAWQNLDYTLKTGKPSFEKIFNKPLFEYLNDTEERVINYHKAMYEYARDDYKDICNKIDFSDSKKIMDVGGGFGALLTIMQKACKEKQYYLFDRPEVIKHIKEKDFVKIGGDFFVEIPNVADTIIMSRVIHDWDDKKALSILNNVYKALPQNGILYIIENFSDKIEDKAALLSLNMHVITQSYERTENEYRDLLKKANFTPLKVIRINKLQFAIKSIKK